MFLSNLQIIIVFFFLGLILGVIMMVTPLLLVSQDNYSEKSSPYECGFNPFEEARTPFDVHFYLVSILFLIFDLEVSFLFPWLLVFSNITFFGLWVMFWFLGILGLGFVFE